jgi:hypothetical protein
VKEVWIWAGVMAVVFLGLGVGWFMARRRRLALEEEARAMGFRFEPYATFSFNELPHPLFQKGHSTTAINVLEGSVAGLAARVFDYSYTVGNGRNRTTHNQTVAAFFAGQTTLPIFEMYPERFYHAIAELVGHKDIDFNDDPAFSSNYRLFGPDEAAVRRCFNPVAVSALASRLGWTVEGGHQTLLVYKPRIVVAPREMSSFLNEAREVARAFHLR